MKKYLSSDDYKHYDQVLSTNWTGLSAMDDHIFTRMFGWKDRYEYYDNITIAEHAQNIKVPTFSLESSDDPITGGHLDVPYEHINGRESNICVGITKHGSHVSHITGGLMPRPFY